MHVNTSTVPRAFLNCDISHLKAGCETKKSHFEGQQTTAEHDFLRSSRDEETKTYPQEP